jgi:ribonuclease HI
MANIIVKNYEHYNKAMPNWDTAKGRYISSKAHYEKVMQQEGMITEEEAIRRGLHKKQKRQEYNLSSDGKALIESIKQRKDKNGNIKLSDRQIKAMKLDKDYSQFMKRNNL